MKIGFNMLLWTHFVTEEHFPIIEKLKQTGYDGIELEVIRGDREHYRRIGSYLRDLQLEATAVTVMPDESCNPISSDPSLRERALAHLKYSLDCCCEMGAKVLCGPFYQLLGTFTGSGPSEEEKKYGAEVHHQAAEYAAQYGITMAVEPLNRFECYFLNTAEDAMDYVRRVNHPNFGLQYDTFHANVEEKDILEPIRKYGSLMKHFHVSENHRGTPGKGHIPWKDVFSELCRSGYDGWVTIEAFGHSIPELAKTVCVWRELSESTQDVYENGYRMIRHYLDLYQSACREA